jgi:hypothetical protein
VITRNKKLIFLLALVFTAALLKAQDVSQLKNEPLVKWSGSIGVSATGYTASGIPARRVPFSWMTTANVNVKLKGVELPFSFLLTEQQRDFRQPFNQFGLSPKFKNVQLHLGWRSLQYSNYTLNGFQFLGAGADIKIKKFMLGGMYGRFLKAVKEDSAQSILNSGSQVPLSAYNRFGYAAHIGYGTENSFVKLIVLKAADKENSLAVKPIKTINAPAENTVAGIKSKLTLAKKIVWDVDAAFSAYTRDTRAGAYPIEDEPLLKKTTFLFTPKLSSSYYYAYETSLGYNEKRYGIKLKYQRVLPDFKSMGTYFLQTDIDRKTVEGRWADKKNSFSINGSVGIEQDNLAKKKNATTKRNIGSLSVNYNPNAKFGLQASWMSYGTTQSPGLKSISDTVKLDQVTNSIIIVPRYTLIKSKTVQNFVLSLNSQQLNDKNLFNSQNFEMDVKSATLSYVLTLINAGYSFDASPFYVSSKNIAGTTNSIGGNIGITKSFLKNKLSNTLGGSYSTNQFNNVDNGYTVQARFNSNYRVSKHHRFQLQFIHLINESKNAVSSRSFNESTGILQYVYTF